MSLPERVCRAAIALTAAGVLSVVVQAQNAGDSRESGDRRPSLSLKASPPTGFSPLRVHLAAELKGGADDFQEFYCPTVEWEWGDGTSSENTEDCNPYEAGKSQIRRRLGVDHTYRDPGTFKIAVRLKQKSRSVAYTTVTIQVRPGAGQGE